MSQLIDLYKQITEGLTTSVLLFNQALQLEYINPAGEILLEASRSRLKGSSIDDIFSRNESLTDDIRTSLKSGNPFTQRELSLTLSNGRIVAVDCIVTPLSDYKARQKQMMLIELHELNRGIRISREEHHATQSSAMRTLLRGIAHEIKNPLGGLRGAAQLLEREIDDPSLKEFTAIIIGEADRLRNLVNSLLGPTTLPQRVRLNIHEVTEHVSQLINTQKTEKIDVLHDYDPSIPELYADRDQLIQALLNISVNALNALEDKGKITFRTRTIRQVNIGHKRHKLVCQVDIIDDGPGVPEDMQETIFFPMVTNRAEGSGLGLSISQSLIQRHDGLIQCTSEPGHTIFRVLLPIENQN